MSDHSSNKEIADGNVTFHFEVEDSYISETEFYYNNLNNRCFCMVLAG